MPVTDFRSEVQSWRTGEVIRLSWVCDGKPVRLVVYAKNGKHYTGPPQPDDPLVDYYMAECGMKKAAARVMARKIPKKMPEVDRMMLALQVYAKEGKV